MPPYTLTTLAVVGTVVAAGCGSDTTAPDGSAVPSASAVLWVIPEAGMTDVDSNGPFSFTFNGAMTPGMERYVDLHQGDVTGPVHPISCIWSPDHGTLTCTPATPLDPVTRFTLHLGGGVRGSNGTPIYMDPSTCGGAWAGPRPRDGHGPGAGQMWGENHGGEPGPMMDSGWRHSNGTYGMVIPFRTS